LNGFLAAIEGREKSPSHAAQNTGLIPLGRFNLDNFGAEE
jgi:hypothetical protein